jgi:hypothetical protein
LAHDGSSAEGSGESKLSPVCPLNRDVLASPDVRLAELEDDLGGGDAEMRAGRWVGADQEGVRLSGGGKRGRSDDSGRNEKQPTAPLDDRRPIAHRMDCMCRSGASNRGTSRSIERVEGELDPHAVDIVARLENVERVVHGKPEEIRRVTAAFLCGGHVLLEDVPGTAKTVLARALAASITDATVTRIQCTPVQRADFNTLDNPFSWTSDERADRWHAEPAAGLHFVSFTATASIFERVRRAMDGHYPNGKGTGFDPRDAELGLNSVLHTTPRQNFLAPPRARRPFPLAELV